MANYGVIDLGSNSVRLVIYRMDGTTGSKPGALGFEKIVDDKVIAGLSAFVVDEVFTPEGVEKASEVLTEHLAHARYFDCVRTDIFATAVLRNCINSSAAIETIEDAIQYRIHLLSAREEAYLGFMGAALGTGIEDGTLVDIGGGSTELTRVRGGKSEEGLSLPMGCVSGYANYVDILLPTQDEAKAIKKGFMRYLGAIPNGESFTAETVYGIGGSSRAVVKLYNTAFNQGRPKKRSLSLKEVDKVIELLYEDRSRFAHIATKAVPERIHTCVPGAIIMSSVMHEVGAHRLEICKYGIREGYLTQRMIQHV